VHDYLNKPQRNETARLYDLKKVLLQSLCLIKTVHSVCVFVGLMNCRSSANDY
jgi:hypothetical protein